MKEKIISIMQEIAEESGLNLVGLINDDTILLESGLDSLGFGILVAKLEDELGYDPFIIMDKPIYPRTFGELLDIYQRFTP